MGNRKSKPDGDQEATDKKSAIAAVPRTNAQNHDDERRLCEQSRSEWEGRDRFDKNAATQPKDNGYSGNATSPTFSTTKVTDHKGKPLTATDRHRRDALVDARPKVKQPPSHSTVEGTTTPPTRLLSENGILQIPALPKRPDVRPKITVNPDKQRDPER